MSDHKSTNGNPFAPATKTQARLRLAIEGPAGSGKSLTALYTAAALTPVNGKIAVIDTERGSASKYSDVTDFDVLELAGDFHPQRYIEAIQAAVKHGYNTLIIDSLSHAWAGVGGVLEQVDKITKRSNSQNTFAAWRDTTPIQNALVDTMLMSDLHLIVTMRTKVDYIIETNDKGKQVPRKVGLAPIQREGLDYEMDVVGRMDLDNNFAVIKTRCPALNGAVFYQPKGEIASALLAWLSDGAEAPGSYVSDFDEDLRNPAVAEAFTAHWREQGFSNKDIAAALGVERSADWTRGRKAADKRLNEFIAENTR